MAKYTLIHGSTKDDWKVFDANSLVEAREYAKSKGWDSTLVQPGDYRTYPGTGYPEKDWVTAAKESDTAVRGRTALETYGAGATDTGAATATSTQQDYQDYLAWQKDNPWMPMPKDYNDFAANWQSWLGNISSYESEGQRQYDTWVRYARQFGGLEDWYPTSIEDWYANYDRAQQQLDVWKSLATENERRELEAKEHGEAADLHALDPAEEARRREESYGESRYAAQERYHEQPRYQEKFASWVKGQSDMSGALEQYVTGKYPSLRAQFESQISPLTGFETREQARAEAAKRETGWQSWLAQRQPDTKQEYWGQRPQDRGERMYMYQPTMRAVNW